MMSKIRKQLSMFAAGDSVIGIEEAREIVDPIQFGLIAAHITLCRESELENLKRIKARLLNIDLPTLKVRFGRPKRFAGHGLMMECLEGEEDFRQIREYILESKHISRQIPHIKLAQPRNPEAKGNSVANLNRLPKIIELEFPLISGSLHRDNFW